MGEKERIRRLVAYYTGRYNTTDPFRIAQYMNVQLQVGPLGEYVGCYLFVKNHRCIFINESLSGPELLFVMAHELGHAIMHRKQNCYFLRNHTYLNTKLEREANLFSAYMVITDEFILQHKQYSAHDIAILYGCDLQTVESRFN